MSEDYLKSMSHEELIEEISLLRESERDLMEMLAKIQALLNGEESE